MLGMTIFILVLKNTYIIRTLNFQCSFQIGFKMFNAFAAVWISFVILKCVIIDLFYQIDISYILPIIIMLISCLLSLLRCMISITSQVLKKWLTLLIFVPAWATAGMFDIAIYEYILLITQRQKVWQAFMEASSCEIVHVILWSRASHVRTLPTGKDRFSVWR